jgi:CoA:oxalate CoA-transferase
MPRPLEGLTVLDLTWILSGPYASMVLCDLGAEVIKVERPPHGDISRTTGPYQNGFSAYYFSVNRGKQSVAMDLRSAEGKDLFLRLCEHADVVIENFTPGTMDRLGLGWEALSARNPRLIMASVSGFGQTGPYRDRPALDIIVQAMGGVMSITGEAGGPPVRPGVSYGDIVAGLYTAVGVLAALQERHISGKGQWVDISMLDCQVSVLENAIARYHVTGEAPKPIGTRHPVATPFQAFPTADGYIVIALGFGVVDQWTLLCSILETPDLIDDPRFDTGPKRTQNHAALEPLLIDAFRRRTTDEWLALLLEAEIPCGPIQTVDQVVQDPQVQARGMVQYVTQRTAGTIPIANTPIRMSRNESGIAGPPADFGEHTAAVLTRLLGLSAAEIADLVERGIVHTEGGPNVASLLA